MPSKKNRGNMGQAKVRGTKEQRQNQAIAKNAEIRPHCLFCDHCQREIYDFMQMDCRNMSGIEAAFAGICECGHQTWALRGDKKSVAVAMKSIISITNT